MNKGKKKKKVFQLETVIKVYIVDLVKLHAEEKQTENAGNVEKSWRKYKEVMETSYWAK